VFAAEVTRRIEAEPNVTLVREEVTTLPVPGVDATIVATGPLTSGALAREIQRLTGESQLYFYDSIAPIVDAESIDRDIVFEASRYGKGGGADYLNCPMTRDEYYAFIEAVRTAELAPMKDFEETKFFEACLPIEVMAERGVDTPLFGPMKPVGLEDPRTGEEPYAVVQLRTENKSRTAYNLVGFQSRMKWGDQKRVFGMIPGLADAEFLRYGSVHRNTFLHGPKLLGPSLELKAAPEIRFAGQITGVEGYVESMACGLFLGIGLAAELRGVTVPPLPATTALGALWRHVTGELAFDPERFQPSNINWSMFPVYDGPKVAKRKKRGLMAIRALEDLDGWLQALAAVDHQLPGFVAKDPQEELDALADLPPRRRHRRRSS
jgi:methylenetetrahydrofolate--tRNA-(uracil-5-)-methyltransferase